MINLKNVSARLISITHDGKRYDVLPGEKNVTTVPDSLKDDWFVKALIKENSLVVESVNTEYDDMTKAELEEIAELHELEGYSRLNKAELIAFLIENVTE